MATSNTRLPEAEEFIADTVTEGQFKTNFALMLEWLRGALGTQTLEEYVRQRVEVALNSMTADIQLATLQKAYPVGSLYISLIDKNPGDADFLGFGTWVKLSANYCLKTIDSGAGGGTNSAQTVTVTPTGTITGTTLGINHMPVHNHSVSSFETSSAGDVQPSVNSVSEAGGHKHTITVNKDNSGHVHTGITVKSAGKHNHDKGTLRIQGEVRATYFGRTVEIHSGAFTNTYQRSDYHGTKDGLNAGVNLILDTDAGGMSGKLGDAGVHSHELQFPSTKDGLHTHTATSNDISNHTHTVSINKLPTHKHSISGFNTGTAGSGDAHTHTFTGTSFNISYDIGNLPTIGVYVWKRTE